MFYKDTHFLILQQRCCNVILVQFCTATLYCIAGVLVYSAVLHSTAQCTLYKCTLASRIQSAPSFTLTTITATTHTRIREPGYRY